MSHHPSPIRLDSLLSTLVLMRIITLDGSNVIKVIPSNGNASGARVTDKRLKVICGANTSYLADGEWIGDKTPLTFAEVRVSPAFPIFAAGSWSYHLGEQNALPRSCWLTRS